MTIFGTLTGEMVYSSNRTTPFGAPALVSPRITGRDTPSVEVHGKSTSVGLQFFGPEVWGFRSGGLIYTYLWGDEVLSNQYGLFFQEAFGELWNDDWRFAAGLQQDLIAPLNPTTLNWSRGYLSGNAGFIRGQFRVERFLKPDDGTQWTLQAALSEPIITSYSRILGINEDNGWPNLEGRVALGLGPVEGEGVTTVRPFEVGLGGVVGELRTPGISDGRVTDVWAIALDLRARLTPRLGIKGELIHGKALGSYLAAALQTVNPETGEGILSTGGWGEVYYFLTPCLHVHVGGGIDDPMDSDLARFQVARNTFFFTTLIWDVTRQFEVGFELGYRETDYIRPFPDNDAVILHTRVQWKF